jgi:hypothetical protein
MPVLPYFPGALMQQRASDRHRILKAATIEFGGGGITCMVRNVSDSGAMLDVSSPVGIRSICPARKRVEATCE